MLQYFTAEHVTQEEIDEAIDRGTVQPWRIDASGEQWYRQMPEIRTVPVEATHCD